MMTVNYIGFAFGLLPVFAAIFNYKNLSDTLKIAALFFLLSFMLDFLMWLTYYGYLPKPYNHPLLNIAILLNIIFYTFFYLQNFRSKRNKKLTLYFGTTATFLILSFIVFKGINSYPDWANTMLGIYMILISLLFFHQLFNQQEFMQIEKQQMFWINSGVLIYFSFTIFLYLLSKKIPLHQFLIINAIANIISNSLFIIGLSCKPQKSASHLS